MNKQWILRQSLDPTSVGSKVTTINQGGFRGNQKNNR